MGRSCQHRPTIDPASGENKRKLAVHRRCPPARPTCFAFPPRARSPSRSSSAPPPRPPSPGSTASRAARRSRRSSAATSSSATGSPTTSAFRPPPRAERAASVFARESLTGRDPAAQFRPTRPAHRTIGPDTMPAGQFFRLGDKRDNRRGSHFFGFRPRAEIIGEATGGVVSATPTAGSARASVASSPSSTEPRHRLSSSPPRLPPGS